MPEPHGAEVFMLGGIGKVKEQDGRSLDLALSA